MPTPFFLKKKARVKNFTFCNTRSIKTTLSWYLYRGKKAREILVEGEREGASESEGKRARSSLRTQKKGEKSTRTFSKLKFERGFVSDFRCVVLRARATLK